MTFATLVMLGALLTPALASAQEKPPASEPKQILPSIMVTQAEMRSLVDRVMATGSIRAVEEIYVQPQVEGLSIKTLKADIGDTVEAGGIVAQLSDDSLLLQKSQLQANRAKAQAGLAQYKAQLAEAQANADDAVRQAKRSATLGKSGSVSAAAVEQAETAATTAAARVRSTEQAIAVGQADIDVVDSQVADIDLKLARTDIKSPVAGLVSSRNAKVGAIATGAGEPLFTVIRDGALELVADVTETNILKIKAGQKAHLTVAGGDDRLHGKVRLVSPSVDPVTRLGAVHVEIDENDRARARAGMYANAEIIITETEGVALPLTAVTTNKNGSTTRRVEDDIIKQVDIETGIQDGSYIQVLSGLKAGDDVVAKAGAFVRDGDRIAPVRDAAALSN
ncbi:MAG: efflux RND transporter periplasmic adaptor subunit [Allorhizobium sp.]